MSEQDVDIYFRLPYPPLSGNNQYEHSRGGNVRLKPAILAYRNQVTGTLNGLGMAGMDLAGPIWVEWHLTPPRAGRFDSENCLKVVKDAMTKAKVWADDSNLVIGIEVIHWRKWRVPGSIQCWIRAHDMESEHEQTDSETPT